VTEPPYIDIRPADPGEMPDVIAIDDDATTLYATSGVPLVFHQSDPFTAEEQARWNAAAHAGRLFLAIDERNERAGFAALDILDEEPYLDQLSVRTASMGRGIGSRLLRHAIDWAFRHGGRGLWLTTYRHLRHNARFYERHGFVVVPERDCGPGVRHHLDAQRAALPLPEERVAMFRPHAVPPTNPRP
jgi:GNAT superfamily N-acetyltransferase